MSQQCHSQSQGVDKSDALALYARLNDIRANLSVARTRDGVITEKVEKLKNDLQSARDEFLQLRSLNDKSSQVLSLKRIEASSIREATKRKYEIIDKLAHLSQDVHLLNRYKKAHREMQTMAKQLRSDCKTSPWVPEKEELINALESDSAELTSVKREMEYMDSKIKEREEMLELHALHPFKDFCAELAMYNRKCMAIKKLLFREMQMNAEMKTKLAENGMDESLSQNLSQSQMTNMMQAMSQRSTSVSGCGISQTQTVSASQDKSSQRCGGGTGGGASLFFDNLDTSEVASPTHTPALRVVSLDTSDLDTSIGKKKASQSNNSNNPSSPLHPVTPDAASMDASDLDTTIAVGNENEDSMAASPARSGSPTEITGVNAADLDTTAINENEEEEEDEDDEPPLEEQDTVVFQEPPKKMEKGDSDAKEKPSVKQSPVEKKRKQNGNESDVEHMFFQSGPEISQNNFLNFSLHSANTSQVAAGDILSLLNVVDESLGGGGGGFFDLFGGDIAGGGDAAGGGDKETQGSAGGMFNFDFGGGTSMDTDGDQTGGGGGVKSFFNF